MLHVVTVDTDPLVGSMNVLTISKLLLTSLLIGVESSKLVEASIKLVLGFLSLDESIHSSLSLEVKGFFVLGVQDLMIMLLLFGHSHFFHVLILNVVSQLDPGVWCIDHGAIWEREGAIRVIK
jgi:hypothetical protein